MWVNSNSPAMKSFSCVGATPQLPPSYVSDGSAWSNYLGVYHLDQAQGASAPDSGPAATTQQSTPPPFPNASRTVFRWSYGFTKNTGRGFKAPSVSGTPDLDDFQPASGSRACRMMPRIGPVTGPWARTAVETFALWPTTPILHERSLKVETIPTEFGLTLGTPPQPKWKPEYGNTFSFLPLEERQKSTSTESFRNRRTCRTAPR